MSIKKSIASDNMTISTPFGFVSYNTENFLETKLNELVNGEIISHYAFILHKGELNPNTLQREKLHFHVRIVPTKTIKVNDIKNHFKEFVDKDSEPLGIVIGIDNINESIFGHWYYYVLHDTKYLNSKHLKKEFVDYSPEMIKTNNKQILKDFIDNIDYNTIFRDYNIKYYAKRGTPFAQLLDDNILNVSDYRDYDNVLNAYGQLTIKDEKLTQLKDDYNNLYDLTWKYHKKFIDLKNLLSGYKNSKNEVKQIYVESILKLIDEFSFEVVDNENFDETFNKGGKNEK